MHMRRLSRATPLKLGVMRRTERAPVTVSKMGEVTSVIGPVHSDLTPPMNLKPATLGFLLYISSEASTPAGLSTALFMTSVVSGVAATAIF